MKVTSQVAFKFPWVFWPQNVSCKTCRLSEQSKKQYGVWDRASTTLILTVKLHKAVGNRLYCPNYSISHQLFGIAIEPFSIKKILRTKI